MFSKKISGSSTLFLIKFLLSLLIVINFLGCSDEEFKESDILYKPPVSKSQNINHQDSIARSSDIEAQVDNVQRNKNQNNPVNFNLIN